MIKNKQFVIVCATATKWTGKCTPIAAHREYHGISSQITGKIKKVRVPFCIDIGIRDVIIPKPKNGLYKPSLKAMPHHKFFRIVRVFSRHSEKLHGKK